MPAAKYPRGNFVSDSDEIIFRPKGRWLNTTQAAEYLGLTARGLEGYVRRGQIRPYKPFGRLLFDVDELDRIVVTSRL